MPIVQDSQVTTSPHVRRNRKVWDGMSEWYQEKHGPQLNTRPLAWGFWAVPESEVGALGNVSGKVVLELGCGGGQWSMFLADAGVRSVGLDLSREQLRAALGLMRTAYPLVQGDAERLPFGDASFDLVLSDYGAMSWADPYRTVPEVARVLRPGGRLAFNTGTPWVSVCSPALTLLPPIGSSTRTSASTASMRVTVPPASFSGTATGFGSSGARDSMSRTTSRFDRRMAPQPSTTTCRSSGQGGGQPRPSG